MFGFSLTKLLFTVIIIAAVWYGFKWIGRLDKARRGEIDAARGGGADGARSVDEAEDMEKCRVCDTYVAKQGVRACGRGDCPYPR